MADDLSPAMRNRLLMLGRHPTALRALDPACRALLRRGYVDREPYFGKLMLWSLTPAGREKLKEIGQ